MQQHDESPTPTPAKDPRGERLENFLRQFETVIVEASQNGQNIHLSEADAHLIDPAIRSDIIELPEVTIGDLETVIDRIWHFQGRLALIELADKVHVHQIRHRHLYHYVAVPCMVQKTYDVRPFPIESCWQCARCGLSHFRSNEKNNQLLLDTPKECPHCGRKGNQTAFKHLNEASSYEDIQILEVQEPPDGLRSANMPSKLECLMRPHLVDKVRVGDKLILNGILKSVMVGNGKKSAIMDRRLEVYGIEKSKAEMDEDLTTEDIEQIKLMAADPDIILKLARSLAPHIYGLEHIKVGCLLQLFGGVSRVLEDMDSCRGDIHILILGDPSTAKSALCRTMAMIHPRGHMADGGSSSAVGLTAAAVKNKDDVFCIEAGPLVIADEGLVFIDELDKIGEEESAKLNEAMESQTVTVNKAGAHIQLSARCSVLAAANPKHDRFDMFAPILPQANIVNQTTLSRFDVIFFLRDHAADDEEESVTRSMLREARSDVASILQREIDVSMIRKYVAFARENVVPELTDEAEEVIYQTYLPKRKQYMSSPGGYDAETGVVDRRKLRALVRLAQASARIRLSRTVSAADAELACRILFEWALQDFNDGDRRKLDIRLCKPNQSTLPLVNGPKGRKRSSDHPDILKEAYKVADDLTLHGGVEGTWMADEFKSRILDDPQFKGLSVDRLIRDLHVRGYIQMMGKDKYRAL